MSRFPRRTAAAAVLALSLALALPFLGWVGELWQQVVSAVTTASESGDPATAPEPVSPVAVDPESTDSSSAGPEGDDTGKLDPNG